MLHMFPVASIDRRNGSERRLIPCFDFKEESQSFTFAAAKIT
jgi:hypothetical protein